MKSIPCIAVHGGAGNLGPDDPASSGAVDAPRLEGARRACAAGWAVLARGGRALDAVEAAVRALEDDPTFNAGRGAVLGADGAAELDASIMDGATLACGAVALVRDVANPVSLARAVMERSPHAFLAGPGASSFAREAGIPAVENAALVTEAQRARWERARARAAGAEHRGGTVGAVARDAAGHLAAATSTGGMLMKRAGRIGDTPIVGAGTYADDRLAAVSCTGWGERVIRLALARHAADLAAAPGATGQGAAARAIAEYVERTGGDGGLILMPPAGEPGFAHDTELMTHAWTAPDGTIHARLRVDP
ncbi:MAG: isoaspartyl peptidase/L-asparaginase [Anaeromyxobacteraceae bacterium]